MALVSTITYRRVVQKATPIADRLGAQKAPAGCSHEQWQQYVAKVRSNELSGFSNPEFGLVRPGTRVSSSRLVTRGK